MSPEEPEVPLGGAVSDAVRIGKRVHRPVGPGTDAVVDLLGHLEVKGFAGAPRVQGFDARGRLMLTWIEGDTLEEDAIGAAGLHQVGRLVRDYHEAVADFQPRHAFEEGPRERTSELVACHGDLAPRNTIFQVGRPVAFVDWDGAFLADPLWDLAHAVWQFVPLRPPGDDSPYDLQQQRSRARALVDGYKATTYQRAQLPNWIVGVIDACHRGVEAKAAAGTAAFIRLVDRGVLDALRRESRYTADIAGQLADDLVR